MSPQSPMISCPLKTTLEIDWITPLRQYIRATYGDPDKYHEECATLNRLRQDMRGAGKDSAAGRDLLYRYYGQLELLDLRFPVDENHIKISFTWYDAFTGRVTAQYSLAFEKASIIFNISAVLSCHAANQNRSEDAGLKTAYHSFQASAGMFTYINENFLHAPSTDLSRDTVKALIHIMLAQAQEVFLEKQINDGKKSGMLAKLAAQAAYLYGQAIELAQDGVAKDIFAKSWLLMCQVKHNHMNSLAQYYQALADNGTGAYGTALARIILAEQLAKEAQKTAASFPSSTPANANLSTETAEHLRDLVKRHLAVVQERVKEYQKDNDFIYHEPVPNESTLSAIAKLPASKAIPVQELYAGQDIQRIIGPDIFQKIVPMAVTESASLYDEEKAKLLRAETEKCELANSEMAAALDYLKLPGKLQILKGGLEETLEVDPEFRAWTEEIAAAPQLGSAFDEIKNDKAKIEELLLNCAKALETEESICEKMRSKYGDDWTQQPSASLTQTLREDIRNLSTTIDTASQSDIAIQTQYNQYAEDIDDLRKAGEKDEADFLFQKAMIKNGYQAGSKGSPRHEGSLLDMDESSEEPSVMDQIKQVEELLKKLNMIKRERMQVLKDLKDKVHNDDINNVLILNKKAMGNIEGQLFASELEKFRPHQNRLLQATHKQSALMKDLTAAYGHLLQDKRVRLEQSKYDKISRSRGSVVSAFKKVYRAFLEIQSGLERARGFYSEMKTTVDSLDKNVDTFVNNRRHEGATLLNKIETSKTSGNAADREQQRIKDLMERMSIGAGTQSPPTSPRYGPQYGNFGSLSQPQQSYPVSNGQYSNQSQAGYSFNRRDSYHQPYIPSAYVPPPPPGPPPVARQGSFNQYGQQPPPPPQQGYQYPPAPPPPGSQQYAKPPPPGQQQQQSGSDPWAGLQAWR